MSILYYLPVDITSGNEKIKYTSTVMTIDMYNYACKIVGNINIVILDSWYLIEVRMRKAVKGLYKFA